MRGIGLYPGGPGLAAGTLRVVLKLVLRVFGIYVVTDWGVKAGTGLTTDQRTANATAFASTVARGGRILVPPGTYEMGVMALTPTTTDISTSIEGAGYTSILTFYDATTTATCIDWAGTSLHTWRNCAMKRLTIRFGQAQTAGAAVRLKSSVYDFVMEDVWVQASGTAWGAFNGIAIGATTVVGITSPVDGLGNPIDTPLVPSGVSMARVKTDLVRPSNGAALDIYAANKVYAYFCDFSGWSHDTVSYASLGVRIRPNSTSIAGTTWGIFDTGIFVGCLVKDHLYGYRFGEAGAAAGVTANIQIIGGHVDGIGSANTATGIGIYANLVAGAILTSLEVTSPWIALYAVAGFGIVLDDSSAGVAPAGLVEVTVLGGKISGCTRASIQLVGTPTDVLIADVRIQDASGAANPVDIQGGDHIKISGVIVRGAASAGNSGVIAAGVTNFSVTGNFGSGKTTGPTQWVNNSGSTASKVFATNN